MRIIIPALIASFILFVSPAHALTESERSQASTEIQRAINVTQAYPEQVNPTEKTNVTGLEWLKLSKNDKLDYISTSMFELTRHGAVFNKTPNDYYNAVKERLGFDHDIYSANVTNILASIVYEQEPGNREALDKIRIKPFTVSRPKRTR